MNPATLFLAVLFAAGIGFLYASPGTLAAFTRRGLPWVGVVLGAVLTLTGKAIIGLPLALLSGFLLVRRSGGGNWTNAGKPTGQAGSEVKSKWFSMRLDHSSGSMSGMVERGVHAGADLDTLSLEELRRLAAEVAADGDPDSVALLEAYLDGRMPGWREGSDGDEGSGLGSAPGAGTMGEQEAYEILGLAPGASEAEIREAHRGLMKGAHPDAGGSGELAARLNEAKDILLRLHR